MQLDKKCFQSKNRAFQELKRNAKEKLKKTNEQIIRAKVKKIIFSQSSKLINNKILPLTISFSENKASSKIIQSQVFQGDFSLICFYNNFNRYKIEERKIEESRITQRQAFVHWVWVCRWEKALKDNPKFCSVI